MLPRTQNQTPQQFRAPSASERGLSHSLTHSLPPSLSLSQKLGYPRPRSVLRWIDLLGDEGARRFSAEYALDGEVPPIGILHLFLLIIFIYLFSFLSLLVSLYSLLSLLSLCSLLSSLFSPSLYSLSSSGDGDVLLPVRRVSCAH